MTDEQARALGERWIKAGGSWMPGMLTLEGYRLIHRVEFAIINEAAIGDWMFAADGKRWYDNLDEHAPDLRDPATRGAALEVVRWRFNSRGIHVVPHVVGCWAVYDEDVRLGFNVDRTYGWEEEALVAALEFVPDKRPWVGLRELAMEQHAPPEGTPADWLREAIDALADEPRVHGAWRDEPLDAGAYERIAERGRRR